MYVITFVLKPHLKWRNLRGCKDHRTEEFGIYYTIMISKNVQNMIPKIQDFFGSQPITKAWLFGSCSRGEETTDSDIDILVEYDRQHNRISLMKIAGIMLNLEDLLHRKVDLVEANRLLPFAQETANQDKFLIYERKS